MQIYECGCNYRHHPDRDRKYDRDFNRFPDERRDKFIDRDSFGCDFCDLLKKKFIGKPIFLGIKCDSIVRLFFGFVTCYSFDERDDTIKLFKSPVGGKVVLTACCSDIIGFGYFASGIITEDNMQEVMEELTATLRKSSV